MRVELPYGASRIDVDIAEHALIPTQRREPPAPLADSADAVRCALERPYNFPPLRRALTPDDHIAIVVDETLPQLSRYLIPVLEHVCGAGVRAEAVTLVCQPTTARQTWLDELPEEFEDVQVEVHDRSNREKQSYLAATKAGHRIYLNRTVVDADQAVVLTRRSFHPAIGYGGGELALYPGLSNNEALSHVAAHSANVALGNGRSSLRAEAAEVTWLLGAPFFVQAIEDADDEIVHILGGTWDSIDQGDRLLDVCWKTEVRETADIVLACVIGRAGQSETDSFACALANAARIVKPNGRIVLLADSRPDSDLNSPFARAIADTKSKVFLLSKLSVDDAEELQTVPLAHSGEIQRIIGADKTVAVLPGADRSFAVVRA